MRAARGETVELVVASRPVFCFLLKRGCSAGRAGHQAAAFKGLWEACRAARVHLSCVHSPRHTENRVEAEPREREEDPRAVGHRGQGRSRCARAATCACRGHSHGQRRASPSDTKPPLLAPVPWLPDHRCDAQPSQSWAIFSAASLLSFVTGARHLLSRISRCWRWPASWRCTASGFTRLLTGRAPRLTWPCPTWESSCSR